jgi:flagellar FliL protein
MADDEKTVVSNANEEAPAKKRGNPTMLIAGIGLSAVAVGIVLALFVINPMLSGDGSDAAKGTHDSIGGTQPIHPKASGDHSASHGQKRPGETCIYAVSDIVVNPAGTGGSRFLSASFGFELTSAEAAHHFEQKEAVIRDALITILASKTVAQLSDTREKEIARLQIKRRVAQLMGTEELAGVYYTDFVLQ